MALQATLIDDSGILQFTAGAALVGGQVLRLGDKRVGIIAGLKAIASGDKAAAHVAGNFKVASASATTFSAGDVVGWDDTAKLAVSAASGDFVLGIATKAKVSGELVVDVALNVRDAQDVKVTFGAADATSFTVKNGLIVAIS